MYNDYEKFMLSLLAAGGKVVGRVEALIIFDTNLISTEEKEMPEIP